MKGWEGDGRSAASDAVASSATFSRLTVVTLCLLSSQLRDPQSPIFALVKK